MYINLHSIISIYKTLQFRDVPSNIRLGEGGFELKGFGPHSFRDPHKKNFPETVDGGGGV